MDVIVFLIVDLKALWFVAVFIIIFYFKKTNKILELERNKEVLYKERCAGLFNSAVIPPFMARLSIYDDFIVIRYFQKEIILNYEDIEYVAIERYVDFNKYIRIKHSKNKIPDIRIYSFNKEKILEILKSKINKNKQNF